MADPILHPFPTTVSGCPHTADSLTGRGPSTSPAEFVIEILLTPAREEGVRAIAVPGRFLVQGVGGGAKGGVPYVRLLDLRRGSLSWLGRNIAATGPAIQTVVTIEGHDIEHVAEGEIDHG